MIKIIIENYYYWQKSYGKSYWLSEVINTETGKSIRIDTPHSSNTYGVVMDAGYNWDEIHVCPDIQVSHRTYKAQLRVVDIHNSCKDQEVIEAIKQLK